MDMATALAELGATDTNIDAETRDGLDRDGYVPLPACSPPPSSPRSAPA